MSKMRLSSVTIQGMHNVSKKTYMLRDFNYLNGLNGAGKTTVMQAIQLALLGYIPGTDKRKEAIFKHAGEPEMKVTLNIDDGGEGIQITRGWTRTSKDIITHMMVTPAGYDVDNIMQGLELPVCNFNEFVGMTSNKLKDWFMWFLPAADDVIQWDKTLGDAIVDYGKILHPEFVKEVYEYAKELPAGLEGIRQLNEWLKTMLSFKKGEASRVQSTIQSLVFYEDCEDGLDPSKIQSEIVAINSERDELKRLRLLVGQNAQVLRDIKALNLPSDTLFNDAGYKKLSAKLASLTAESASVMPDVSELEDKLAALNEKKLATNGYLIRKQGMVEERQKVLKGEGICPYTSSHCVEISKLVEQYTQEVSDMNADIVAYRAEIFEIDKQITDVRGDILRIQNEFADKKRLREQTVSQINADLKQVEQNYAKLTSLQARVMQDLPDKDDAAFASELSALEASVSDKQALVVKIEANKRYNELTDSLTKQKYQIEQDMEILKDWIKLTDVNGLQSKVMDKPFEQLADRMTDILRKLFESDEIRVKFHLSEKANSFSFGIIRDNAYLPFDQLSGGEKCLYTLALLTSIVDTDDIDLPIVLVDDLLDHLDRPKIDALFNTLNSFTGPQIILAGVQECRHPNGKDFIIEVVA